MKEKTLTNKQRPKMKNKFLLLVVAFVLSTTTIFATTPSTFSPIGTETSGQGTKDDMCEMVRQYMESQQISVTHVAPEPGTQNYLVKDVYGIWYRVYTQEGYILGYDEIDA
jgi:hypothetical protein